MIHRACVVLTVLLVAAGCGGSDDSQPSRPTRSAEETARARFYEHVRNAAGARRREDWDAAVRHLEAALKARPDHEASLVDLAVALRRLKRRDEAIQVLERLRREHPGLPRSHVLLADVLAEPPGASASVLERASELYRHALDMEPNVAGPRLGLARVLLRTGDPAGAEREFRTVLGTDPQNLVALTGLGETMIARDRAGEAVPHLLRALAAGTRAKGRRDVPSEMDTEASFEAGSLASKRNMPALRALRRAREALGRWPEEVPAAVRQAAMALPRGR